jgi:hypothetical protein
MNILLWILQILVALHTAIGAVWKLSNTSEQTMASFALIPQGVWLAMAALELLCAMALLLPALNRSLGKLIPIAAGLIVAEMLVFCWLQFSFGEGDYRPVIYWLVVAAICAFIAYGRGLLVPLKQRT